MLGIVATKRTLWSFMLSNAYQQVIALSSFQLSFKSINIKYYVGKQRPSKLIKFLRGTRKRYFISLLSFHESPFPWKIIKKQQIERYEEQ
jgi:hypothetical protein